ncbi:MAG: hypothetical protein K2Y56_15935 [Methylobacterium sp.]|nr:hypothetical protein [Methylobacterium sp.]
MAETPTIGDLFKAKAILETDVAAAVDAFLADPSLTTFLMGDGYSLDLHGAVSDSPFALGMMANPVAKASSKRSAIRTAILLAKPVKGRAAT